MTCTTHCSILCGMAQASMQEWLSNCLYSVFVSAELVVEAQRGPRVHLPG